MKNVQILFPTEAEAKYFEPAANGVRVAICGVGMAECAATTAHIITTQHPDTMILAGIAGACSDGLAIGETVTVTSEIVADLGRFDATNGRVTPLFQKTYENTPTSTSEGVFRAVASNTVNTAGGPVAPNSAEIENMEGAAFFAVCQRFNIPMIELRTISNRVGKPVTPENLDTAARKLAEALEKLLTTIL